MLPPRIEVHVDDRRLTVAVTSLDLGFANLPRDGTEWTALAAALARLRAHEAFEERHDIGIVGHRGAIYADVVRALELADRAGFDRPHYTAPDAALFVRAADHRHAMPPYPPRAHSAAECAWSNCTWTELAWPERSWSAAHWIFRTLAGAGDLGWRKRYI